MDLKKVFTFLALLFFLGPVMGLQENTDSLLNALRTTDLPSEKIIILNKLAKVFTKDDPMRSENYASQALFISESIENIQGRSEANYNLGVLANNKGQYEKAMTFFTHAEEGFDLLDDEKWLAKVFLYISQEHKRNHEYEKAIPLLFKSMETFDKLDKKKKLAETYNALGGNFYDQGNYERAFEYYEKSLKMYEVVDDLAGKGSLHNNLGEIYRINLEYEKAIENYQKALNVFLKFHNPANLSIIYNNLGNVYLELKDYDSSSYYLNLGMELADFTNDIKNRSSSRILLGKLFWAKGDWEQARDNLMIGYDLAVQSSNMGNIIEASEVLSELYQEKNDFERAYYYFVQYRSNEDSLHNKSNLGNITQLEMSLLFDLEHEVQNMKVQRTNLQYFTIAIILISLIIIVVLLYGRQRIKINQTKILAENLEMERVQLQDEIDFKNRELATNVMYLVKKNELINYITEKLLKAKTNFKPSIRKTVDSIILELQSNVDENIWSVFEDRFKEVHEKFYNNLNEQFPKLSENDKKLCAFIRLDMNTKEIATITHQNPNSIEVARTRLRKKLNITNTDTSLNSFLSKI